MAQKLLPAGCDQQSRYPTRPQPAEACTEIGADDNSPGESMVLGVLYGLVAWLAIAAFAFVVSP